MIADWLRHILLCLVVVGTSAATLTAQRAEADALLIPNTIKMDKVQLPSEARKANAPVRELGEDWYVIEAQFETVPKLLEEVTVKFYTDMVDTLKDGQPTVILTSETTFINIPAGKGHTATAYLHPTSVLRYGGKSGAEGIKKANVHVELLVGGRVVDKLDMRKDDPNWHTQFPPAPGVLIPLQDSPFWPFEALRFNQIKPSAR